MKTIAVMIEKGGAGKTTTAAALAEILARNNRVLAIDADQQGNLSTLFHEYDPEDRGLARLLTCTDGSVGIMQVSHYKQLTASTSMQIVTANGYLMDANMELAADQEHDQIHRLAAALAADVVQNSFDYCVIDCGLLLDHTVLNALAAADLVLTPVKLGGFEVAAMQHMAETVREVREVNQKLQMLAVMTMKQKNQSNDQMEQWLREASVLPVCSTTIRRSVVCENASIHGQPVTVFSPRCAVAKEYEALTCEVVRKLKEVTQE